MAETLTEPTAQATTTERKTWYANKGGDPSINHILYLQSIPTEGRPNMDFKSYDDLMAVIEFCGAKEVVFGAAWMPSHSVPVSALMPSLIDRLWMSEIEQAIETRGFAYSPRGIGNNWIPCGICGEGGNNFGSCQNDMAAFVSGLEGGICVLQLLEGAGLHKDGFKLDYRPYEPDWVQIKIGACEKHVPFLEALYKATCENRRITPGIVKEALEATK